MDRSFSAYCKQSPTMQTIASNRKLWKVNLVSLLAGTLVLASAACGAAVPPEGAYFSNCTEARQDGYSNLKRGEPGYRIGLDRDHDGIACEN